MWIKWSSTLRKFYINDSDAQADCHWINTPLSYCNFIFYANRGKRSHRGNDVICRAKDAVYAPITGILRRAFPYGNKHCCDDGFAIDGTGEHSGKFIVIPARTHTPKFRSRGFVALFEFIHTHINNIRWISWKVGCCLVEVRSWNCTVVRLDYGDPFDQ